MRLYIKNIKFGYECIPNDYFLILLKQLEDVLNELKEVVDYFVIDTLFKDDIYGKNILSLYKNGYEKSQVESILEIYDEKWDDGFYTTKTVYLKEDLWLNY